MIDRLEKIKKYRREAFIITHDRFDGRLIEFKDADKFIDYFDWLIAEIERLQKGIETLQWLEEIILKSIGDGMEQKIESLTKERDELKWDGALNDAEDKIKELEAENAELKRHITYQTVTDVEWLQTRLDAKEAKNAKLNATLKEKVLLGLKQCSELLDTQEKLAASEKACRIKKLWNIAVKCNLCGAIFPDKHTGPCAL